MTDVIMSIRNVHFQHNLFASLRDFSLDIEEGQGVVVFGMETSGVDVICHVLSGLEKRYDGSICYKGCDVRDVSFRDQQETRRDLVYVERHYGLMHNMTVLENIMLPLSYHAALNHEEITELAEKLIDELGLEYCRDMRPVHLRPSQALTTAYARAIALDPDLLMIEHPLEGQCPINILPFLRSMKQRSEDPHKTLLVTTYKPRYFLDICNRFVMLHEGRMVFDGTGQELVNGSNEWVRQYLGNSQDGPINIF